MIEPVCRGLTTHVVAGCRLNVVVQLAADQAMEAGMREQALFDAASARPILTADECARELLAGEVAIVGMHGVY